MLQLPGPVVSESWLRDNLRDVVVADVRWGMAEGSKRQDYRDGHLRGAVFVDLDLDLSAPPGETGRHPLPDSLSFAAALGRLGVSASSTVVSYDDAGGAMAAARLWYMLDSIGVSAAVLDGGIQGWSGELETGEVAVPTTSFPAREWPTDRFVEAQYVAENLGSLRLFDARSAERFRGVEGGIDDRPGHIPGAYSAPWAENLDDTGRFRASGLTLESVDGSDATPVVYCGSGVSACHTLLALRLGGTSGRLYTGSFSEWAIDPNRPVERS